ncbi:GmrSD restriction endonuclease domain-containing protein [Naasia lichenicola]|uniref:DUF1524 domain-containing protein n=1 Tax=Naasia lichenicola TaxID=2565933 RepID=A0A4S4FLK7_9MICO|nr:DUF1524 domain-containing protein [Naasia lichenicola]THG30782.1 DUF1524 domain-containing protein [Naasia lichenicola]THG32019.1 DUF1524 domain-containing protein [Naasia lichenicola]
MSAPAAWYDNPDNEAQLRYWDGSAWTAHFAEKLPAPVAASTFRDVEVEPASVAAPAPAMQATAPAARRTSRFSRRQLIIGGALAFLVLIISFSGGFGALLVLAGLVALGVGAFVLVTGRRSLLRLASRKVGAGVLAGGLIVAMIGGGVNAATNPAAGRSSVEAAPATTGNAEPTMAPTPTASAKPTPAPTPTAPVSTVELDPAVAEAPLGNASVATASFSSSVPAIDLLGTIAIKGRAPKTGYARTAQFGTAWLDVDRNGCDTRNDILARDLADEVLEGPCKVMSGTLLDPYTAKTISFLRGNTTSTLVQIDHVVPLMDAWQKGAQQLTYEQRVTFANDPLNLLAVDGPSNSSKGAGDAATWLPKNTSFRCAYVARQVAVKATYGLWMTQAEHDAIAKILGSCPGEMALTSQFTPMPAPAPVVVEEQPIAPAPAPAQPVIEDAPEQPAPAPAPVAVAVAVAYANCDAVRAAGAAPIHSNEPGYSRKLDRDGDGIACE